MSKDMLIPVSLGELLDKITILEIKKSKIKNFDKLSNIDEELNLLSDCFLQSDLIERNDLLDLKAELKSINLILWEIEDKIRNLEDDGDFGQEFIEVARSVYKTNDKRFEIKNTINRLFNSKIKEEKSYKNNK